MPPPVVVNVDDIINEVSIEQIIPAEIYMISACKDEQTSSDVPDISNYNIPNRSGVSGGACTSAFLQVVYADKKKPVTDVSWLTTLNGMRRILKGNYMTQIPQLTSSRSISMNQPVNLAPKPQGTKRAVLIGIKYAGSPNPLSGCHNDVLNMKSYLTNVWNFPESCMAILMDDGEAHTNPTRQNILAALSNMVKVSKAGDVCVFHYSGHGGSLPATMTLDSSETDGKDETICPVDYTTAGQITDTELYQVLVTKLPKGVVLMCLMDCCHSGTVLDLPYICVGDGQSKSLTLNPKFNMALPSPSRPVSKL